MNITTIGLDLAKNVFQIHGIEKSSRWMRETPEVQKSLNQLGRTGN